MSRIFLVRHGERSGDKNCLIGRSAGYRLTTHGENQVKRLTQWVARQRIARVYASPRERCMQTARLFVGSANLEIEVSPALDEFDFGEWTGRTIASLEGDEQWRRFNSERGKVGAPGGETMVSVQARIIAAIEHWAELHEGLDVIAVSHAEPIRAALLYSLGMPLDDWSKLEVAEAAVNTIECNHGKLHRAATLSPGSADLPVRCL